jgi:hypothetical protein
VTFRRPALALAVSCAISGSVLIGCSPQQVEPTPAPSPTSALDRVVALSRAAGVSSEVIPDAGISAIARATCDAKALPNSTTQSVADAARQTAGSLGLGSFEADQGVGIVVGAAAVALCATG